MQSGERVFDHRDVGVGTPGRVRGDRVFGTGFQCMPDKVIPIEIGAPNGDVDLILEVNTGVDGHAFGPRPYLDEVLHDF